MRKRARPTPTLVLTQYATLFVGGAFVGGAFVGGAFVGGAFVGARLFS